MTRHYPGRVPPFGYPRIYAHLQLPAAFRSLSRPSSAISALASTLRSFLLDLLSPLRRLLRPLSGFLAPRFLSRSSFLSFPVQFSRCALALRARPSPARKFRLRLASLLPSLRCPCSLCPRFRSDASFRPVTSAALPHRFRLRLASLLPSLRCACSLCPRFRSDAFFALRPGFPRPAWPERSLRFPSAGPPGLRSTYSRSLKTIQ